MLKISETEVSNGAATLRIEGEMIGPWVTEVRRVAEQMLTATDQLTLDLTEVMFVDRDGVALLRQLMQRRVKLINCSPFLIEQLKDAGSLND